MTVCIRARLRYGGLVNNMPRYAAVFMIFMLGSVGLPGTSGFVGEFLTLLGTFRVSTGAALAATSGVVLGAAYMLVLYRRVVFGPQRNADAAKMPDLNGREFAILAPLAAMVIFLGVFPNFIMSRVSPSVDRVLSGVSAVVGDVGGCGSGAGAQAIGAKSGDEASSGAEDAEKESVAGCPVTFPDQGESSDSKGSSDTGDKSGFDVPPSQVRPSP